MRAGKIRNVGAIQQNNVAARDGIGGEVANWQDFINPWYFDLVDVKGGERLYGRTVHAQATYAASGRYVAGVTAKMRLTLGARVFDILSAANVQNRDREMQLDLLERNV